MLEATGVRLAKLQAELLGELLTTPAVIWLVLSDGSAKSGLMKLACLMAAPEKKREIR